MIEYAIIKCFLDVDVYNKYHHVIKLDYVRENYPVLYKLFKSLPATTLEGLEANYLTNYPIIKQGDREIVADIIKRIENTEVTEEIKDYLEKHLQREWANEVALSGLELTEGRKTFDQFLEVINAKNVEIVEDEIEFVSTDIEELMREEEETPGLKWRLKCLNQSLGQLRKGNFGHIFARVETGKTAMWISEATYMATQVNKPILIFFNEEGGKDVIFRMHSAVTGMTYLEITKNIKLAKKIWEEKIGDRIKFIDQPSQVEKKSMEKLIEKLDPELIICDNMDKVKGFAADREDMRLHEVYKWGREIAKTQCPFISVGQADASGHNSMFIDESQMANSKTGKPSELDFIIGIGRIDKVGYEDVRYISIPKNKLRGDSESIEGMRHIRGKEVMLKPMLSIYEDM